MKVVILGASGLIGQQFVRMISEHPSFKIQGLYAKSSAGKRVRDIWRLPFFDVPESVADTELLSLDNLGDDFDIAFSGLPSSVAGDLESRLREDGKYVFSNASSHRMDDDVPILIPEINGEQISLVEKQGKDGFIVTNSNCSISGVSTFLHELYNFQPFSEVHVSTYQAMSGAGFKGLSNESYPDNVVPYIAGEEEKMEKEGVKITGRDLTIHANCARVPVPDGHIASVNVRVDLDLSELKEHLLGIRSPLVGDYSVAPERHLIYLEEDDRPQPKLDSFLGSPHNARGMATSVGRLRYRKGVLRAFVLAHNTIRGGAGGSVLNAEYALNNGYM